MSLRHTCLRLLCLAVPWLLRDGGPGGVAPEGPCLALAKPFDGAELDEAAVEAQARRTAALDAYTVLGPDRAQAEGSWDTNVAGGSYEGISAEQCAAECDAHAPCVSFSYSVPEQKCYLKSRCIAASDATVPSTGYQTYYKPCTATTSTTTDPLAGYLSLERRALDEGVATTGGGHKVTSDVAVCAQHCNADQACNSFTFYGPSNGCHLKVKCVTAGEPTVPLGHAAAIYKTYYKPCPTTTRTTSTSTVTTSTSTVTTSTVTTVIGTSTTTTTSAMQTTTSSALTNTSKPVPFPVGPSVAEVVSRSSLIFDDIGNFTGNEKTVATVIQSVMASQLQVNPFWMEIFDMVISKGVRRRLQGSGKGIVSFSFRAKAASKVEASNIASRVLAINADPSTFRGNLDAMLQQEGLGDAGGLVSFQAVKTPTVTCPCPAGRGRIKDCDDASTCTRCQVNEIGGGSSATPGICSPCPDGSEPSGSGDTCAPCAPDAAGTRGFCSRCFDGMQPDAERTSCQDEEVWGMTEVAWVAVGSGFAGLTLVVSIIGVCWTRMWFGLKRAGGMASDPGTGSFCTNDASARHMVLKVGGRSFALQSTSSAALTPGAFSKRSLESGTSSVQDTPSTSAWGRPEASPRPGTGRAASDAASLASDEDVMAVSGVVVGLPDAPPALVAPSLWHGPPPPTDTVNSTAASSFWGALPWGGVSKAPS